MSILFKVFFWVTQFLFVLPALKIGGDLLIQGKTEGVIAAIALLLAWIGGTLVWGLASIMHTARIN
jgi:hypothetical protein